MRTLTLKNKVLVATAAALAGVLSLVTVGNAGPNENKRKIEAARHDDYPEMRTGDPNRLNCEIGVTTVFNAAGYELGIGQLSFVNDLDWACVSGEGANMVVHKVKRARNLSQSGFRILTNIGGLREDFVIFYAGRNAD